MLTIYPEKQNRKAQDFCKSFINQADRPRYVLGCNEYAASINDFVDVDGFIDEFTEETSYLGKPIVKLDSLPKESLVVSVVALGRPLIALRKLEARGLVCLDYFSFVKYSGLGVKRIELFQEGKEDIDKNLNRYQWIYNLLANDESRVTMENLLNFRYSSDLTYMHGFVHSPEKQYFEPFLDLKAGEVFVDAGGFDGQTTIDFIKRCPGYKSVHFFEPDPDNIVIARKNLSGYRDIHFYILGLAESKKTLRFSSGGGSASKMSEVGDIEVHVNAIDALIKEPVSLIKMDIEGAEGAALKGAWMHIKKDRPKLAICCYHKIDDFWKIPEQVLAVRDDYSIYLCHYTEGFTETVMYFIPKG